VIDPLISAAIRHSIDHTQYGNYVLARMIRLLNKTDADLVAQLGIALQDQDAESFKVQRLDKLLVSVRDLNAQAYKAMTGELNEELKAFVEYEGGFQYSLYQSIVPATLSIAAVVPEQAYAAAMAAPMQGRLLKDWASGLETTRLARIKDAISIGFTQGKTTGDIVREIRGTKALNYTDGILDASRRDVESVVQTAISHTAQMTRSRFYDANANILGAIQWVSTLDGKTSYECRVRDGLKYTQDHKPIGHSIPWGAGPGRLHWRCRSSSIGLLLGQKELTGTRSSANGTIDAKVTYSEWLRQQSAEVQDEVLGKAKGERYRADGMKDSTYTNDKGQSVSLKELRERDKRQFG
jgi:hypothetical protein